MSAKHTPGSWEGHIGDDYAVVMLPGETTDDASIRCNAYLVPLIAAAPDLLSAAKRALAILRVQGESVRPGNALGALDAAIAKAEGRQ